MGIPFMETNRYGETQTARKTKYWLGMEGKLHQSSRILTHESDTLKWLWLWANFGINNITTSQFHVMQPQKRNAVWAMACSCESEGIDSPGDDKRPWCSSASGTASWANSMIEVERLLVGGFNPLKNMKVSWDDDISQYMEKMFETTVLNRWFVWANVLTSNTWSQASSSEPQKQQTPMSEKTAVHIAKRNNILEPFTRKVVTISAFPRCCFWYKKICSTWIWDTSYIRLYM